MFIKIYIFSFKNAFEYAVWEMAGILSGGGGGGGGGDKLSYISM